MSFIIGETYTRDRIHSELGGEKVSYLPQHDGSIVCGCFSTESNPEAPSEILVGGKDEGGAIQKKARLLAKQGGIFPVFLKQSANKWRFDGFYRVKGHTEDGTYLSEKQAKTGRAGVVMALSLESVSPHGKPTYLLTWNPDNFPWDDREDEARLTADGQSVESRWSCGNTKRIEPGDRLFLLRQGVEPRGIVAAGWATSTPDEAPHWDEAKRQLGETAVYVDVRFDRILNPDLDDPLPLTSLQQGPLASVHWSTQKSGIEIKVGIEDLERLWAEHLRQLAEVDEISALEGELRMAHRRHRAREGWLRDAKLDEAKKKHMGRLPCEACGFDFFDVYGEKGSDYAHVHHLKPLGEMARPSFTKLGDLAVVCANCHAMIHRGGKSRPLKGLLRK